MNKRSIQHEFSVEEKRTQNMPLVIQSKKVIGTNLILKAKLTSHENIFGYEFASQETG
jgi:hypothetical protein